MLAAIYCRLSKEDSGREDGANSESIVNQRKLLTDYAQKKYFEIFDYYIDEDRSGLDRERPEFLRLIEDARQGKFSVVLCKTQSRFTRDMELVEKYIHGLFPLWGIRFISVVETYDTAVKGNKKARQISGLVNEWYSEDLSENIKAVLHKKMQDGEFIGSFACYGYKKAPEDRHALEIEEETAQVVRDIYNMYLEGYGIKQIADILRLRQVLTPTAWKQSKGLLYSNPSLCERGTLGKSKKDSAVEGVHDEAECFKWSTSTVKKILSNETYIGTLIQGREQKISYKDKKMRSLPRRDWVCIPNHHEAIVSKEVFEQVRSLRGSRKTVAKGRSKANPLSGKLFCMECQGRMVRNGKRADGEYYWKCRYCTRKNVRQSVIYKSIKQLDLIITDDKATVTDKTIISDTVTSSQKIIERDISEYITGNVRKIEVGRQEDGGIPVIIHLINNGGSDIVTIGTR